MEFFSAEFFSALAAIVVIDLVLAGDNAIVIALAARNLPAHLRTKAIVWGTFGAIAVRTAMTMVVVWLLKIPGLLLVGGLCWCGSLTSSGQQRQWRWPPAGCFEQFLGCDENHRRRRRASWDWTTCSRSPARRRASFLLVVLGLLISIPIVIWGSQLILKFVERYPGDRLCRCGRARLDRGKNGHG